MSCPSWAAGDAGLENLAPHYEGPETNPRLPRQLWFRLVEWLHSRGELPARAHRAAHELTWHATRDGRLGDTPRIADIYAAQHHVSTRTFWYDLRSLAEANLVRRTAGAAPGRPARYVLALPSLDDLPPDPPKGLVGAVRYVLTAVVRQQQVLVNCQVTRFGSVGSSDPVRQRGCGQIHTSPFFTRRTSPSPPHTHPQHRNNYSEHPPQGQQDRSQPPFSDLHNRCQRFWVAQRGPKAVLNDADWASLSSLIDAASNYLPPSELVEELTHRTRSARNLASVCRYRLRRVLRAAERAQRGPRPEQVAAVIARREEREAAQADGQRVQERNANLRAELRARLVEKRDRVTFAPRYY